MKEKIINALLLGIISVGIISLIQGIIKMSEKISHEYALYIGVFSIISIFGLLIQFAPDSCEE